MKGAERSVTVGTIMIRRERLTAMGAGRCSLSQVANVRNSVSKPAAPECWASDVQVRHLRARLQGAASTAASAPGVSQWEPAGPCSLTLCRWCSNLDQSCATTAASWMLATLQRERVGLPDGLWMGLTNITWPDLGHRGIKVS